MELYSICLSLTDLFHLADFLCLYSALKLCRVLVILELPRLSRVLGVYLERSYLSSKKLGHVWWFFYFLCASLIFPNFQIKWTCIILIIKQMVPRNHWDLCMNPSSSFPLPDLCLCSFMAPDFLSCGCFLYLPWVPAEMSSPQRSHDQVQVLWGLRLV